MEVIVHIFHEFYFGNLKCIRARIAARVFDVFNANTMLGGGLSMRNIIHHRFSAAFSFAGVFDYCRTVTSVYFFQPRGPSRI